MKDVRITAVAKVRHDELIERYELPLEEECTVARAEPVTPRSSASMNTASRTILRSMGITQMSSE